MKKSALFILIPFLTLFVACGKAEDPDLWCNEPPDEHQSILLTKTEEAINQNSNEFGLELFRSLYQEDQVMVSPLSASLALSMTAYGARGNTESAMLTTLGFKDFTRDQMGEFFKKMVEGLSYIDPKTTLAIANSIWAKKQLSIKSDFKNGVAKYYGADVKPADFGSSSIIQEINQWCSQKTNGLITNAADTMDPSTVMSLVNALYFKGSWASAFNTAKDGNFAAISGSAVATKLMDKKGELFYASNGSMDLVSIPYGNRAYVMDLILPVKTGAEGFRKVVEGLNWDTYSKLVSEGSYKEVVLTMPVFKLEYGEDIKEALCAMGMASAFSNSADFSGISDSGLTISQVIHKTLIDVNEKGTEAAAVTIVDMRETSAGPSETIYFTADRPFIFAIRECSTNALLFVGQKVK